jgi:hypothetical protein
MTAKYWVYNKLKKPLKSGLEAAKKEQTKSNFNSIKTNSK